MLLQSNCHYYGFSVAVRQDRPGPQEDRFGSGQQMWSGGETVCGGDQSGSHHGSPGGDGRARTVNAET
jgi:hypothetical protein